MSGFVAPLALETTPNGLAVVRLEASAADCVKLGAPLIPGDTGGCPAGSVPNDPASGGAIIFYVKEILKLLAGAVGLIIVLMLIIAGIQYMTSAGDPSMVKKAKERIINAITALVLFVTAYAIINFIIPGGVLG